MSKLSKRLKTLAEYIDDNCNMVDIGCDHGLLDIYLIQNKNNINIIASDVNENALNNAKSNIKRNNLDNKIKTILSNGLDNIDMTNLDTIVISGMGAHTIVGILYNNLGKLKNIKKIVIQSNNDIDFLRYKVTKIGYYINRETLVKDAGIIYTIIEFKKGYRLYSKKELYLGPCLIKEKSDLFIEKCRVELKKMEGFYPVIPKSHYHHRLKIYYRIKILKKILTNC